MLVSTISYERQEIPVCMVSYIFRKEQAFREPGSALVWYTMGYRRKLNSRENGAEEAHTLRICISVAGHIIVILISESR